MRTLLTCIAMICLCAPAFADDSSASSNATPNGPEAAIKQRAKEFDATWATHDPKAIAAYYTTDGNIVTPDGNDFVGRDGIEQCLTDAFNGNLKDSKLTTTVEKVRLIKPDVAIVDSGAEVKTPDGEPQKLHLVSVLVKKDGKWLNATTRAIVYQQH